MCVEAAIFCVFLSIAQPLSSTDLLTQEACAEGVGPASRASARDSALTVLVAQTVAHEAGTSDLAIFQPIIDNAPQYGQRTHIVSVTTEDNMTCTEVQTSLNVNALREDMASLIMSRARIMPKVLLLLREETGPGEPVPITQQGPAEAQLVEIVRAAGLNIIAPDRTRRLYTEAELHERVGGDADVLTRFGTENVADVVIVGTLGLHTEAQGRNALAYRVTLHLQVVRAAYGREPVLIEQTAEIFSTESENAFDRAIKDAFEAVKPRVLQALLLAGYGASQSGGVVLTIEPLHDVERTGELVEALSSVPGVSDLEVLLMKPELARFRFSFTGQMLELVHRLSSHPFPDYRLATQRVVGTDMRFVLEEFGENKSAGEAAETPPAP